MLTVADRYGFSKDVQSLIRAGIDVNARFDWGQTALISVARWGEGRQISPEVMKILIQAGVDVNVKDNYGHDALFYAAKASNAAEIKALLQPEVDQKVKTKGSTARSKHYAVFSFSGSARSRVFRRTACCTRSAV